eukprot:GILI01002385.1.p1 GENE.GILI01002385.1~~GILI01002385.1.p1  ORF type:complete len:517 (-),score=176.57 GILI01002385.1:320-1870(-)
MAHQYNPLTLPPIYDTNSVIAGLDNSHLEGLYQVGYAQSVNVAAQYASVEEAENLTDDVINASGEKIPKKTGKWSPEEDEMLRQVVAKYGGKQWKKISEQVPGRSSIQCLHRWTKILQPGLIKGPWTLQEDAILRAWVEKEGAKKWAQAAALIPGRSGKQCRERWFNHLNPEVKKGNWTPEEDSLIFELYQKLGSHWSEIATHFEGRTENAIKNRFYSTLRRLSTEKKKRKSVTDDGSLLQTPQPSEASISSFASPPSEDSLDGNEENEDNIFGSLDFLSAGSLEESRLPSCFDPHVFEPFAPSADVAASMVGPVEPPIFSAPVVPQSMLSSLPMPVRAESPAIPADKMTQLQDQVRKLEMLLQSTKAELVRLEHHYPAPISAQPQQPQQRASFSALANARLPPPPSHMSSLSSSSQYVSPSMSLSSSNVNAGELSPQKKARVSRKRKERDQENSMDSPPAKIAAVQHFGSGPVKASSMFASLSNPNLSLAATTLGDANTYAQWFNSSNLISNLAN